MARKKVEFTGRCVVVFSPVSASRGILVAGRKTSTILIITLPVLILSCKKRLCVLYV